MKILQIFKEQDGQWSMRRTLAFLCVVFAAVLAFLGIQKPGWHVYIPTAIFTATALFMLFFTTWGEIESIVRASKGK